MCMNTMKTNGAGTALVSACSQGWPVCRVLGPILACCSHGEADPQVFGFLASGFLSYMFSREVCTPHTRKSTGCSSQLTWEDRPVAFPSSGDSLSLQDDLPPNPRPPFLSQACGLFAVSHLPPFRISFEGYLHVSYPLYASSCVCDVFAEFTLGLLYVLHAAGFCLLY